MKKLFLYKSYFVLLVALLFIAIIIGETIDVYKNPSVYETIYRMSEAEEWKYKNVYNYVISNYIWIVILSIYFIINVIFIMKKNKKIQYLLLFMESIFLILGLSI